MKNFAYLMAGVGAAALVFGSAPALAQAAVAPNVVAMAPIPNPPEKPHMKMKAHHMAKKAKSEKDKAKMDKAS